MSQAGAGNGGSAPVTCHTITWEPLGAQWASLLCSAEDAAKWVDWDTNRFLLEDNPAKNAGGCCTISSLLVGAHAMNGVSGPHRAAFGAYGRSLPDQSSAWMHVSEEVHPAAAQAWGASILNAMAQPSLPIAMDGADTDPAGGRVLCDGAPDTQMGHTVPPEVLPSGAPWQIYDEAERTLCSPAQAVPLVMSGLTAGGHRPTSQLRLVRNWTVTVELRAPAGIDLRHVMRHGYRPNTIEARKPKDARPARTNEHSIKELYESMVASRPGTFFAVLDTPQYLRANNEQSRSAVAIGYTTCWMHLHDGSWAMWDPHENSATSSARKAMMKERGESFASVTLALNGASNAELKAALRFKFTLQHGEGEQPKASRARVTQFETVLGPFGDGPEVYGYNSVPSENEFRCPLHANLLPPPNDDPRFFTAGSVAAVSEPFTSGYPCPAGAAAAGLLHVLRSARDQNLEHINRDRRREEHISCNRGGAVSVPPRSERVAFQNAIGGAPEAVGTMPGMGAGEVVRSYTVAQVTEGGNWAAWRQQAAVSTLAWRGSAPILEGMVRCCATYGWVAKEDTIRARTSVDAEAAREQGLTVYAGTGDPWNIADNPWNRRVLRDAGMIRFAGRAKECLDEEAGGILATRAIARGLVSPWTAVRNLVERPDINPTPLRRTKGYRGARLPRSAALGAVAMPSTLDHVRETDAWWCLGTDAMSRQALLSTFLFAIQPDVEPATSRASWPATSHAPMCVPRLRVKHDADHASLPGFVRPLPSTLLAWTEDGALRDLPKFAAKRSEKKLCCVNASEAAGSLVYCDTSRRERETKKEGLGWFENTLAAYGPSAPPLVVVYHNRLAKSTAATRKLAKQTSTSHSFLTLTRMARDTTTLRLGGGGYNTLSKPVVRAASLVDVYANMVLTAGAWAPSRARALETASTSLARLLYPAP